jgi:hypothetical protein
MISGFDQISECWQCGQKMHYTFPNPFSKIIVSPRNGDKRKIGTKVISLKLLQSIIFERILM